MRHHKFAFIWKWLACTMMLITISAYGENVVPCLIFTGNSGSKQSLDLSKLNRITFDNDGFTVSSSNGGSTEGIRLLYSLFNHIEIGDDTPTNVNGIDKISISTDSKLLFREADRGLKIETPSTNQFMIGIFNMNGVIVATSNMDTNDSLSLEALSPGAYVAVATDGEIKLTLKFIIP